MRLVIVAVLTLCLTTPLWAQSLSCPAHSHLATVEPDGSVSAGSLDKLRDAYRTGSALRIGWEFSFSGDPAPEVTHWAEAAFLTEFENVITAQVGEIERQVLRTGASRIDFGEQPQRWSGLLSTDGTLVGRFSDGEPRRHPVRSVWCLASGDTSSACSQRWRLAYHHDADGKRITGSKARLSEAVRRGRPFRLAWGFQSERETTISIQHVAEPVFITVSGGEVSAQLPEHVQQQSYADPDRARFDTASVLWRGLMSTTGTFDAVWVDRASGEEVRRYPQRAAIAWYVLGPAPTCETEAAVEIAVPGGVRRAED